MKEKIEELSNEIRKRDKVVKEWNETLTSVDSKIAGLEDDKKGNASLSLFQRFNVSFSSFTRE